ncbi:hypothetical protein [Accumulibacter sp.]|uniref:hypothetical protein n=1 Tax=Accumulibacter sp. TaxID=2053492 RepID=UPI001AC7923C|nr:hypothetical protein [Accumulibacter sp.]MBN8499293.1 hypothetical protein [Accumulibacter sp.]
MKIKLIPICLAVGCCLAQASPARAAGPAAAPRLENSTIHIDAVAGGVHAEGKQGGSSSSKGFLGRKKSSSTPDMPGQVDVGVVDLRGATVVRNSDIRINATAAGVSAHGATVRVGSLVAAP